MADKQQRPLADDPETPPARRVREMLVRFARVQAVYAPAAEAYRRAVTPQVRVSTSATSPAAWPGHTTSEGDRTMSATTYAYYQHTTSGDLYAVAINERGTVVGSVGPLDQRDLGNAPEAFAVNMEASDNDWFYATDEFRLVEESEARERAQA